MHNVIMYHVSTLGKHFQITIFNLLIQPNGLEHFKNLGQVKPGEFPFFNVAWTGMLGIVLMEYRPDI